MANQGGTLKSNSINGVKVYTVAGQHRPATWLPQKKRRASSRDKDYSRSVELLQDLRFETATSKIKATPDGEFLLATGIYPPQVKVYELRELSLKFERTLVSEIINFQVLGDDYSKLAFLCADRSVRLHAKYGSHYSLRIPRMGRDIAYDCWSCDLLCAASSPDLYRINLEQGRFLSSLSTQSPALNVVTRSKLHGLVACGGDDGAVECFDMRTRASVGRLNVVEPAGGSDEEVTALEFDGDAGYHMAVGTSAGKIMIYDLRSSSPLRVEDHKYGSPILNIKWHQTLNSERAKIITTDKHIVRIWDPDTGDRMTSIQPTGGSINDLCVYGDSGLMLLALDNSLIPSYFIPALGPAPKWCSHLENLTEELEEGAETSIYDHFKFLTKEDLEKLNLTNLIGTNLLRASMHGFFINHDLYKKAQAMANPFAYDDYIEQRKKEKLEAERMSRITLKRKLPKVNRTLASRILQDEETEVEKKDTDGGDTKKRSKKKKGLSSEDLKDERFDKIFKFEDFEIDETSPEYLALHPVASTTQPSLVEEHFEPVMDDEELSDSDASQSSDDDPANHKETKSRAPRLYEVKDQRHAEAYWKNKSLAKEDALPLGERVTALTNNERNPRKFNDVKLGPGGSREISFMARSSSRYREDEGDDDTQHGKRRGVQSLKLKPDRSGFQGRGRGGGRGGGRGRGRGGGGGRGRGRGRR